MIEDPLFRGLEPPVVPARLREDALAAAGKAFAAAQGRDPWTRLLASPAARLAWAASVAALAAAHVLLPRHAEPEIPATASNVSRSDPELASTTRLPRIDEHALPALEGDRS